MRIAVVGTGYWGRNHVRVWRELLDEGRIDHMELFDINRASVEPLSRDFGVDIAESWGSVLGDGFDAVDLITPTSTHADLGIEAMKAGKDLLVEKPMAATTAEARLMIETARENDRILMPGHIFRYHEALGELERMVKRGDFGRILQMHTHRTTLRVPRSDMGVLLALAIHDVDNYCLLKGGMPSTVYCETQENHVAGIEDSAFILTKYGDGTLGVIHNSWSFPVDEKVRTLAVIGSRMSARIDYLKPNEIMIFDRRVESGDVLSLGDEGHRVMMVDYKEPLKAELGDFAESVSSRQEPKATSEVGLRALELVEAAIESSKSGMPVKLD